MLVNAGYCFDSDKSESCSFEDKYIGKCIRMSYQLSMSSSIVSTRTLSNIFCTFTIKQKCWWRNNNKELDIDIATSLRCCSSSERERP